MIESIIRDYLSDKLSAPIYITEPEEKPESFFTLQRVSAGMVNKINAATIEFYCYAPTKYEAALLDEELKTVLLGDDVTALGITEDPAIFSCKYGGGNDAPDTAKKLYRYRAYYNFAY